MEFGKLDDISDVNFTLPPDPESTRRLLHQLPLFTALPRVYIGPTGWSMKEWVGKVYPPKTLVQDFLWYYSRQFNTIELNTTHYRIPDQVTIEKWKKESAHDFRFCPKVPQSISHSSDLALSTNLVMQFCQSVAGLGEKLGCCFLQLPPHFGLDQLALLEKFLSNWPREIPLAMEFRHESWFTSEAGFDLLEKLGIATVITDVAGRRDVLHQRITREIVLIRFVGNGLHPTDFQRINHWVTHLKDWLESGIREVYFFAHEPDNILAPDLSLYLADAVKTKCGAVTRGPVFYEKPVDPQMSLF